MHHALAIQEILSCIFGYCCPSGLGLCDTRSHPRATPSDMIALARTCRAFKDPALDVLWRELGSLSPLAQCLPDASHKISSKLYLFSRSLTQPEWNTLRSYTRRIQTILNFDDGITWESVKTFLDTQPTNEPLFPNLQYLHCKYIAEGQAMPLLHLPLPSLVSLDVMVMGDIHVFRDSLESFAKSSPNIRRLSILTPHATLPDQMARSGAFPSFSNLRNLVLHLQSLVPMTFLSRTQLPAITDFTVFTEGRPSKRDVADFFVSLLTSGICHTMRVLGVSQVLPSVNAVPDQDHLLGLEDLQPCMTFHHLRRIIVNIQWTVGLADVDLLTFASTWPHLEHLLINEEWGWDTANGGITPNGLVRLLKTCRSLTRISLAIDTRGCANGLAGWPATDLRANLPRILSVNVLDSVIEEDSVKPMAAFLASISLCDDMSGFRAWSSLAMMRRMDKRVYYDRWKAVFRSTRSMNAAGRRNTVT